MHLQKSLAQAKQQRGADIPGQPKIADGDKKIVLNKQNAPEKVPGEKPETRQPEPAAELPQCLLVSIRQGVYYPIRSAVTRLGRVAEKNDLVFKDDTKMSRSHAQLLCETYDTYIQDVKSSNGTWVNGRRLAAYEKVRLDSGDLLQLGDVELV